MPGAWVCPCCAIIWAPHQTFCCVCTSSGQLSDELRVLHTCPLVAQRIAEAVAPLVTSLNIGAGAASSQRRPPYRVEPRPHIAPHPRTIDKDRKS